MAVKIHMITKISMQKVEKVKGVGEGGRSLHRERKLLAMYLDASCKLFRQTDRLTIVTDASMHGTNDLHVAIAYDHSSDCQVYCTAQAIGLGKKVAPGEFDLDEDIERLLVRSEHERLKSYKFLQLLSHQVFLISSGRLQLASCVPHDSIVPLLSPLCDSPVEQDPVCYSSESCHAALASCDAHGVQARHQNHHVTFES